MQALKEASTVELLDELMERCAPAVFIGTKYEGVGSGYVNFSKSQGAPKTCFGMCHEMAVEIQMNMIRAELEDRETT